MNSEATETCDAFMGGRVQLYQPVDGYRAGVDPVLLAAATPAQPGQTVLELGCGAGAASLCLHARVTGLSLTGVEMQPLYADLARRNAVLNGADMRVVDADLRHLPSDIKARGFDHVIANPPYYDRARSTSSINAGRDMALAGDTPLSDWIDVAAKRLAPKGYLTMIQKADRLPDILTPLMARLGSVRVWAIQPRVGRLAELVIVQARKGGRAAFVMEPPLILHEGERHLRDGESYTAQVLTVLREGGDLPWGH